MNCIPGYEPIRRVRIEARAVNRRKSALVLCLAAFSACGSPASEPNLPKNSRDYEVVYFVTPDVRTRTVEVAMELRQSRALLRELSMDLDERVAGLTADGELQLEKTRAVWRPPAQGGSISWQVQVDHRRNGDGFDAWLGPDWGVFRAEDIIPRATTRSLKGAKSHTAIVFKLPAGWSAVTQYHELGGQFRVSNPERRFDQPSGWIIVGEIGVRREIIAGSRIAVAGPVGNTVRRMDMLALLNWTLPDLARLLPELPSRLTIVAAGSPMWRGGLSAPQSLFIHADRPLISENATSTLLHEVMHLALGIKATANADWIVEGLAEYYSLELLMRSGTISQSRYATARSDQEKWGESAETLCQASSSGASSALAVTIFAALDQEMRAQTAGKTSLDDLVGALWSLDQPVGIGTLNSLV